ncbi:MAG: DUF3892 domain-containing protein [Hydrogenophaga sp.]|nr:DUF3892 domain-containing protein [Hydrogenophaga sp.]
MMHQNPGSPGVHEFEISCISKPRNGLWHHQITHVGNLNHRWRLPSALIIRRIELNTETYYLLNRVTGRRSNIAVVHEPGQRPYLRAHAGGEWNDDLLSLRRCTARCNLVG